MAIRSLSAILAPVTNQLDPTPTDLLQHEEETKDRVPVVRKSILGRISARRLGKLLAAGLLSTVVCSSTGCSMTSNVCRAVTHSNGLDTFMINHRNKVMATKAWFNEAHCFENCANIGDIRAGFIQGYTDVASGGDGCAPAVAPSSYWGWKHQSAGGQSAMNSWFHGYPLGVRAAERDGVGNWGRVRPNMSALQPQEAVYRPPPAAQEEPYFDESDRYPYEPESSVELEPATPTEVDEGRLDDPIGDALESGFDDTPMDFNDAPGQPSDVGDAIRDALDAPADSAQANPSDRYPIDADSIDADTLFDGLGDEETGQVFGEDVAAEPEQTGVRFSIDHDEVMERMFGDGSIPPTATSVDPPIDELPYTFD